MSNNSRKTDKRKLFIAVLCVVMVLAMIVPTVLSAVL